MHGTRFASSNRALQLGKGMNLPAGTVVDTEITSYDKFDFYLQSSMGIQVQELIFKADLKYSSGNKHSNPLLRSSRR